MAIWRFPRTPPISKRAQCSPCASAPTRSKTPCCNLLTLNMRLRAHAYSSSISICCHFLPLHFASTKSHTRRDPEPENPGSAKGCTSIQTVSMRRRPECPVRHVGNKKIILIGRTRKNEPHETATAGDNADGLCRLHVSGWTGIPGKFDRQYLQHW